VAKIIYYDFYLYFYFIDFELWINFYFVFNETKNLFCKVSLFIIIY